MYTIIIKFEDIIATYDRATATYRENAEIVEKLKDAREQGAPVYVLCESCANTAAMERKIDWCTEHLGIDERRVLADVGYINWGRLLHMYFWESNTWLFIKKGALLKNLRCHGWRVSPINKDKGADFLHYARLGERPC